VHGPDGRLAAWPDIEHDYDGGALLVGNGLSINVWPGFAYRSLFERAARLHDGGLTQADRRLFQALATENFESVLAGIDTTMRVHAAVGEEVAGLAERYRSIQRALGAAVRAVHVPWALVPARARHTIQRELQRYAVVFTTNYDLLLYWAMGHEDHYGRLVDCFWARDGAFDAADARPRHGAIPVLFLHGALHLATDGAGRTFKLKRRSAQALLEQFGRPSGGDDAMRPLLVTEGSARDKLRAIEANGYLTHAYDTLGSARCDRPVVVFGSALGPRDGHLADALGKQPNRPVAVSMMPAPRRQLYAQQAEIYARVRAEPLVFFDATTHPLGTGRLRVGPYQATAASTRTASPVA
jgi:hypothetical protein